MAVKVIFTCDYCKKQTQKDNIRTLGTIRFQTCTITQECRETLDESIGDVCLPCLKKLKEIMVCSSNG